MSGKLFRSEHGQGLAEYAVMLGLLLALFFIAKAIGFNANRLFNFAASTFQ
ncbi:MAG: hypothetical protein WAN70_07920 [Terriglobales bacterium]